MSRVKPGIDQVEVVGLTVENECGRSRPLSKSSRNQEYRTGVIRFRYKPTGEERDVLIPRGKYTKKQFKDMQEKAKAKFLASILRDGR